MKEKRLRDVKLYCAREAKEHLALSESVGKSFEAESPKMQKEAERLALIALGQAYGFEQVLKYLNARRN